MVQSSLQHMHLLFLMSIPSCFDTLIGAGFTQVKENHVSDQKTRSFRCQRHRVSQNYLFR